MKKNNDKEVYILYVKHQSELQMYYGYVKCIAEVDTYKGNKITKAFCDRYDSNQKLSEMLDYILNQDYIHSAVIILWSVLDINKDNFQMLKSNFKVVSMTETEEQLNMYYEMITQYYNNERDCIVNAE